MNVDQFFSTLSLISWIMFGVAVLGVFVLNWVRLGPGHAILGIFQWRTLLGLVPVVIVTLLSLAIVFVPPTHAGVVISFLEQEGIQEQYMQSGPNFIVPVAEQVIMYPIYQQTYTMSSNPLDGNELGNDTIAARTSDGQEVFIDVSIIFAIDQESVVRLHIAWQDRYVEDLIRPLVRGVVRTEVSSFDVAEVNSVARNDLEIALDRELREQLAVHGITMDTFLLRNIAFSPEYAASVEQKQVALERRTESLYQADVIRNLAFGRADEIIRLSEARAEARLIEAQAESEALQLIANVLEENLELLTYRYIDKISPNIGVMVVPQDNPLILPLNATTNGIRPLDELMSGNTTQEDANNTNETNEQSQESTNEEQSRQNSGS